MELLPLEVLPAVPLEELVELELEVADAPAVPVDDAPEPPPLAADVPLEPELAIVAACAVDPPAPQPARTSAHMPQVAVRRAERKTITAVTSKWFCLGHKGRTRPRREVLRNVKLLFKLWKTPSRGNGTLRRALAAAA